MTFLDSLIHTCIQMLSSIRAQLDDPALSPRDKGRLYDARENIERQLVKAFALINALGIMETWQ